MYERVRTGIHVVRMVASIFPYLNLETKSEADRSLDVVRTGCWVVRTDVSWHRSFSIQWRVWTENHVVRTDDAWSAGVRTAWHVVWTARAMDKWASGRDGTVVRTADREPILLTCNQYRISEILLNSGLPVKSIFTYNWFCPKQNEANHKLTNSIGSCLYGCKVWYGGWSHSPLEGEWTHLDGKGTHA
jgi:hypothetical protein